MPGVWNEAASCGLFPSLSAFSDIWAVWKENLQTWAERQVFTRNYENSYPCLRTTLKDKIGVRRIFLLLFRAPDVFHGFFQVVWKEAGGIHWMWQSPQMLGGRRSVLVRHNKVQCTSVTDTAAPGGSLVYKPRVYWRTSDLVEDCMSDMGGCYQERESYHHRISPSVLIT